MVDITGKKDAVAIKERYQREINVAAGRVKKKRDWLRMMNHKLKNAMSDIGRLRKDILADEDERRKLYSSLQNLLKEETNFEKEMWKTTQKGRNVKTIKIDQKFKDSDVEARYDAMQDFLRRYPKYRSKSSFSKILDKIAEIEAGIKKTTKEFNKSVADAKREIEYFPRNILEAKNKIKTYRRLLAEGQDELKDMRFTKSFLFKISPKSKKLDVTIDTINHRVDEYEASILRQEQEVKAAKEKLKEMKL